DDLSAARLSLNILERRPNDPLARNIYNFSVARTVENVQRAKLQPWRQPIRVVSDQGSYLLTTPKATDSDHEPSRYDLFPTDTLKIGGTFFKSYSSVGGVGAPIVAVGRTEASHFRQQYRYHRVYAPITAALSFSGRQANLEFIDPLKRASVELNRRVFPLAADFSASTALLIVRERPERLGASRVFNPEAYANTAMLWRLQQFDPPKTPVIFFYRFPGKGGGWGPINHHPPQGSLVRGQHPILVFLYSQGFSLP